MTLVAAWIQKYGTLRQLVVASDSRLSGGEKWDGCPKIVPLPRPGTLIAMSGDATAAYAFMIHAINSCLLNDGLLSGRADIQVLARRLRDTFADSRTHVHDLPSGQQTPDIPDLDVVLLGWSWRRARFEGYSFRYDTRGSLRMHALKELHEAEAFGVYFFGDAAPRAKSSLKKMQETRNILPKNQTGKEWADIASASYLAWEPLEVLMELIAAGDVHSVGGEPQIAQIYQYNQAELFVWRDAGGVDHFGGRPVQAQERFDRRVMTWDGTVPVVKLADQSPPWIKAGDADEDAES